MEAGRGANSGEGLHFHIHEALPEGLSHHAGIEQYGLGLETPHGVQAAVHRLHDVGGIPVGEVDVHALGDEAVEPEGAVFLDMHHAAQPILSILTGDQRKLKGLLRVVVELPVDLQKLLVDLRGGLVVQLDQMLALRPGDLEGHAQGHPADGLVHIDVEICPGVGDHQYGIVHDATDVEYEVLRGIELMAAGIAAEDVDVPATEADFRKHLLRVHLRAGKEQLRAAD